MDIANIINNLALLGVPAGVLIAMLIQLFKTLGLPTQYSRYVNGGLAVVIILVSHLLAIGVLDAGIVNLALQCIIAFLVAAGFYDSIVQPTATKIAELTTKSTDTTETTS
jgi:hypothetical protein